MRSQFPSHNSSNSPYRDAIAALGEGHAYVAVNPDESGHDQNQPLHGLPQRTNRDRLNAIASNLGVGVQGALTLLDTPLVRPSSPEGTAETSPIHVASSSQPAHHSTSLNDVVQALAHAGVAINKKSLGVELFIRDRLSALNVSTDTLLSAVHLAQTPENPSMAALGLNHTNKQIVLSDLSTLLKHKIRIHVGEAAARCNNNPEQLIAQLLSSYK